MGLEEIGVVTSPFIQVDSQLRTNKRNIFAIGDVNGLSMLDSGACAQARIAVDVIMGGQGCVIIGNGAAEVINLAALAIQSGVTSRGLERLFVVHPSVSVILQRCARKFR